MNKLTKISGPAANKALVHFFTSLPQEKKETCIQKLVENLNEETINSLIEYLQDPAKAVIKGYSIGQLVEVKVEDLDYSCRNTFAKHNVGLHEFVQGRVLDFKFNSSIDLILKIEHEFCNEVLPVYEYYIRKIEIL
jgi:hypothetical protein